MIRQNRNQCWIWLISHFLITNLSSANDSSVRYYSPSANTYNSSLSELSVVISTFQLELCQRQWSCSSDISAECYCENLCSKFGDCCKDKNTTSITTPQFNKPLAKHLYNCSFDETAGYSIYTVIGCPVEYANKYVRKKCEQPEKADKLLHIPVSGVFPGAPVNTPSVKFYNFYCAICHGVTDYNFWNVACKKETFLNENSSWNQTGANDSLEKLQNCSLIFFNEHTDEVLRSCKPTIDECPDNKSNHDTSNCTEGPFQPIYSVSDTYKNKDCALCNNVDIKLLTCFFPMVYRGLPSMAQLYNIDSEIFSITKCDKTSIYDVFTGKCRPIYSPRSCGESNLRFDDPTIPCPNCQLIKLDENEYSRFGDSIYFKKPDLTINESLLYYAEDKVYICSKDYIVKNASAEDGRFDEFEWYVTLLGVSLSMLALFITFSVYASFRSLRNVPGKMSMNLVASMFLANLLFVSGNFDELCTVIAVCMHYIYLVSFFWMNALSFDAWNTFTKSTVGGRNKHCLKYYSIYCWITPLLIVSFCIFVQFTPFDIFPSWLSPRYGPPLCWISSKWSLVMFFAAPLFLLILCNVVFYSLTIRAIYRTEKLSDRLLSKKNKGTFLIYLKLCFIMGINWMFALLHTLTGSTIIGYISVFLNSFQGFWVGCSYLFSKQVCRQLKGKFPFLRTSREQTESKTTESKQTSASYLTNVKSHS